MMMKTKQKTKQKYDLGNFSQDTRVSTKDEGKKKREQILLTFFLGRRKKGCRLPHGCMRKKTKQKDE